MTSINVTELRRHLPEYLKQVQAGEEVIITVHGKAIARLCPTGRKANAMPHLSVWMRCAAR